MGAEATKMILFNWAICYPRIQVAVSPSSEVWAKMRISQTLAIDVKK